MTISELMLGKDLELMGLGWERDQRGLYRKNGGAWMPPNQARIAAGLTAPPEPPQSIKVGELNLATMQLTGALRTQSGAIATFTLPLTIEEQASLHTLLDTVTKRLRAELRALE